MASFVCRSCRLRARNPSLLLRLFSTSAARSADDPASQLADLISPTNAPRPPTDPGPSRTPDEAPDSKNPFLHPSGYDLPNDTKPQQRAHTPFGQDSKDSPLVDRMRGFMKPGTSTSNQRQMSQERQERERQLRSRSSAIEGQMSRIWRDGDVYSPHDLSPAEQIKSKNARQPTRAKEMKPVNTRKGGGKDVLDDLSINPMKEYKNFKMMSEFVTEMGRIRHARETGFRAVNQRKMAKAVRRAHALGLLPTVHRHPELMPDRESERSLTR